MKRGGICFGISILAERETTSSKMCYYRKLSIWWINGNFSGPGEYKLTGNDPATGPFTVTVRKPNKIKLIRWFRSLPALKSLASPSKRLYSLPSLPRFRWCLSEVRVRDTRGSIILCLQNSSFFNLDIFVIISDGDASIQHWKSTSSSSQVRHARFNYYKNEKLL